jgi:hypothetical protein
MNTKTLVRRSFTKEIIMGVAVLGLVFSSFFALSVPRAHAAALTSAQIQAILNLLTSFNVPASTVANVSAILHKSK